MHLIIDFRNLILYDPREIVVIVYSVKIKARTVFPVLFYFKMASTLAVNIYNCFFKIVPPQYAYIILPLKPLDIFIPEFRRNTVFIRVIPIFITAKFF